MLQMFYNVAVVVIFVAVNCEIEYPNVEYCPVVQNCRAPLIYNVKYRCASDKMCPQGYKCCRSDCYIHKVCVVAVNKNGEKIPLPIVTTDGYTELNAKETESVYTTEVDNGTEDITITENNSASIIIETTTNFSDKSEDVSSTNSIEEENITIADRFSDTAVTQMETVETTIYNKSTESTQNTSNVSNWIVDVGDTDETEVTTKTTILLTVTEFTKLTTNTKNEEDVEGSGGFYTNDDEDKVSSVKNFTSTSSTHISDDEDVIQGSGSGRGGDTDDNIVFPDDGRVTTFKPARDKHTTSNVPPTDKDFGFDTYFTPDTTASTHNTNQSAIENIRTSSESFPTYIPERNSSTDYLITTEKGDVGFEGSGNDLTDDEPGDVNEENITETPTAEDNFTNSTNTESFPMYVPERNLTTRIEGLITEKVDVALEGSGNDLTDDEPGDVNEENITETATVEDNGTNSTSTESFPMYVPERNLSTRIGDLITTEKVDVALEGSDNDLTDNEPGDVNEENITETAIVEDNGTNRTSTESFPMYVPERNLSTRIEDLITTEKVDVALEGSGNVLTDNEPGDVNEKNITETATVKDNFTNSTSTESFPMYVPERNLSTRIEDLITTEKGDVVLEGSSNNLTDNKPGVVNEENITETSTVEDNFTNRTSTVTTPFAGVTYKNKSGTNTDEIDIDLPSSTIKQPDIVEKTTVVAIVEGSGNEFSDTENGDVDEEMTTYIPDNKKETIIEDSTKSSLNVTTPLIDLSVITVTEDEDDDDYDHDGVDEDIRNNFQGRITSG